MLQQDEPDDFVIGTGKAHTVGEFLDEAFGYVNLDWSDHVETDPRYFRPTEVHHLEADVSRARDSLKWRSRVRFRELARIMVDADLEILGLTSPGEGRRIVDDCFGGWHTWGAQVISTKLEKNA